MPPILPLRTVALQALFLVIAIAIEAIVLYRQLKLSPREGVQYAATINLLSTVLGWVAVFTLLDTGIGQQFNISLGVQVALLNFILFNRLTPQSASSVVLLAFITFLVSFAVKQFGLVLLKWALDPKLVEVTPPPDPEERSVMRDPRKLIRQEASPQVFAVLVANALSYSAIGAVLLLLLLIQNS
ncbi:filament integrity protein FraC [Leptolyngbya ohadii]|uniref:filament integrity protein FraC n=1 Tax=Leptolyngbya ohadii TaxID=1962290 RepID=UPI000B59D5DC|nr:filament integrity protein FraC [Leptolyngbya ohadii]